MVGTSWLAGISRGLLANQKRGNVLNEQYLTMIPLVHLIPTSVSGIIVLFNSQLQKSLMNIFAILLERAALDMACSSLLRQKAGLLARNLCALDQ